MKIKLSLITTVAIIECDKKKLMLRDFDGNTAYPKSFKIGVKR